MKNLLTKKNVLIGSSTYFLIVALIFVAAEICDKKDFCRIREDEFPGILIFILLPLFFVFIFSLLTYRMRPFVFDYWMKFAVWATPLLMLLTYMINMGGNNGFGVEGVIGGAFDAMILMILYGLYCGISIWRVAHAHRMK